jgi:hypothetical protein
MTLPLPRRRPPPEVRSWAQAAGLDVSDRGRLRPEIWVAWRQVHHPAPAAIEADLG